MFCRLKFCHESNFHAFASTIKWKAVVVQTFNLWSHLLISENCLHVALLLRSKAQACE